MSKSRPSRMNSEHEMCQNCKRDIPVQNYRNHTAQCIRSVTACPDCGDPVSRDLLDVHHQQFHSPRECPLCGISVQAVKLHGHKRNDCPKRSVSCKYCQIQKIVSEIKDHENQCGSVLKTCPECASQICLRDYDSHKLHHKNKEEMYKLAEKTAPSGREGMNEYKAQTLPRASNYNNSAASDANTLLPCEFCEELVPMFKLLEHQAECVNPSNVRGSGSGSVILRSHSMYNPSTSSNNGLSRRYNGSEHTEAVLRRKLTSSSLYDSRQESSVDDDEEYLPCEFCGQSFLPDYIMKHQMTCDQNPHPSNFPSRRASTYLTRASSAREGRASTEDRQLRPLGSTLSRQDSFTTSSRQRRGESLTRQNSFSRNYLSHRTSYDYTSPTASSIRRASIFDGYSGYAIYSSISQGLDEITYGGRRSRRNSITESSYSRPSDSFALPTLLAMQGATSATPTTPVSPNPRSSSSIQTHSNNPFTFSSSSTSENPSNLCRNDSERKKTSPKVKRNVSFTGAKPIVINEPEGPKDEPQKPTEVVKLSYERKKKKEPPHIKLFEEVNDKLKALEAEQKRAEEVNAFPSENNNNNTDKDSIKKDIHPFSPSASYSKEENLDSKSTPPPVPPRRDSLIKEALPPPSSSMMPSASLKQKRSPSPSEEESLIKSSSLSAAPLFPSLSSNSFCRRSSSSNVCNNKVETNGSPTNNVESPPQKEYSLPPPPLDPQTSLGVTLKDVTNEIELRQKNGGSKTGSRGGSKSGSKAGSKRNSLDSKTVQGLAQDLAAECAKAYALMESSLSKLSTDFSVAPFGISPKKKSLRKTRAHSTLK